MQLPPPHSIPTIVQHMPVDMPSGGHILERFDETTPLFDTETLPPPLPPRGKSMMYGGSKQQLQKASASFLAKHGLMMTNTLLTIIVFSLLISQAKSSEKTLPVSAAGLLAVTALILYQRYNYSRCLDGHKWVGYFTAGSLFVSMIVLSIWIAKSK